MAIHQAVQYRCSAGVLTVPLFRNVTFDLLRKFRDVLETEQN